MDVHALRTLPVTASSCTTVDGARLCRVLMCRELTFGNVMRLCRPEAASEMPRRLPAVGLSGLPGRCWC